MAKSARRHPQFLCSNCGSVHPKWMGKCPDCGAWDTLQEYREPAADVHKDHLRSIPTGAGAIDADLARGSEPIPINQIDTDDIPRIASGIGEFDRVLGGGIVPGSAVLVGGEPGIGKSTLLLEFAGRLAQEKKPRDAETQRRSAGRSEPAASLDPSVSSSPPILYVTSEESARQTRLRAQRLGIDTPNLFVLAETNVERILHQVGKLRPAVVIVDSIQMIYRPDLPAAPGSVTQLRECCMQLVYLAKTSGIAIVFVGHVTKEGTLAGPKIIEHIVDTVVYFEGDRYHAHRVVRCVKNRFGSTHEVGLFDMTGKGLTEVTDPGRLFVEHYGLHPSSKLDGSSVPSGSVLTAAMQGSRVLLVEVQALTASSVIGAARRKVSGVSADRVGMIIAVLEKRGELRLAAEDVFVNVAGGVKVAEPSIDLAIALAIASAHGNRPLPPGMLALGELGLGGEVRPVPQLEQRLREASRLGVAHATVPPMGKSIPKLQGMAIHEVRRLGQAIAEL
ncbi:MAG TPA: DNA repair protein RadA [Tepidisphaeraceae bacterium]|nr:DNA repair protein RadA [Tepidisphaeraceae bacterium]